MGASLATGDAKAGIVDEVAHNPRTKFAIVECHQFQEVTTLSIDNYVILAALQITFAEPFAELRGLDRTERSNINFFFMTLWQFVEY